MPARHAAPGAGAGRCEAWKRDGPDASPPRPWDRAGAEAAGVAGEPVPSQAPKMSELKLIGYDFVKYGSSAERSRLLTKWDKEVKALPK